MSFYRTYRPNVIDEIDNARVRSTLSSLLGKEKSKLPHAYLFTGSRGTGKTTAARVVAKILTCEKPSKAGSPCGECESCRLIAEGRHMDVLEIDAASNRGIDEIRTIRDGISLAPVSGDYKVYIIDEVHMLTTEAFNALLKTLEEPPVHAFFVLATTDPQKLPKTIISRCLHINFSQATTDELMHALKRITKEEKMTISDDSLGLITKKADGSFRDAVKMLEQVSFLKEPITPDAIESLLSISSEQSVDEFLHLIAMRDMRKAVEHIGSLVKSGIDMKTFVVELLERLEYRLLQHAVGSYKGDIAIADVKDLITRFSKVYGDIKTVSIPQLPLELAVVEFCEPAKDTVMIKGNPQGLAAKVLPQIHHERLENKNETEQIQTAPSKQKETGSSAHAAPQGVSTGLLTIERLMECWKDVIEECKPVNHSIAGVLRSARPKDVSHGIVTIEAFYKFHQEKISELKTREMLSSVFKKLFGENVKIEVVLGKK